MVKLAFLKALQLFVKMIILDNDQTRSYQPIKYPKHAPRGQRYQVPLQAFRLAMAKELTFWGQLFCLF